jgi:Ca2+-binding EF-hand superfamily protein
MGDSGVLHVRLSHATGLKIGDSSGLSDPFVKLALGKQKFTSQKVYKTLNPRWDQDFLFRGKLSELINEPLQISVWDYDKWSRNDPLGNGVLYLNRLQGLEQGARIECVVELKDRQAKPGEVVFIINWEGPGGAPAKTPGSREGAYAPRPGSPLRSGGPRGNFGGGGGAYGGGYGVGGGGGGGGGGASGDIERSFYHFDVDRSGYIDVSELRAVLRHYGFEASTLQTAEVMRRYDDNPDGQLSLQEFGELVRDLNERVVRSNARSPFRSAARERDRVPARVSATFDEFDVNRSGFLDYAELRNALRKYGVDVNNDVAADILRSYDDNPNGLLDLLEFAKLVADLEGSGHRGGASSLVSPGGGAAGGGRVGARENYQSRTSTLLSASSSSSPIGRRRPPYSPSALRADGGSATYEWTSSTTGWGGGGAAGGVPCAPRSAWGAYLMDVLFRTLVYSLVTTALIAPGRLVGDWRVLANAVGETEQGVLRALPPGHPSSFWLWLLAFLALLIAALCCVFSQPGGLPGVWARCCRAIGSCCGSVGGYDRYDDLEDGLYGRYGRPGPSARRW